MLLSSKLCVHSHLWNNKTHTQKNESFVYIGFYFLSENVFRHFLNEVESNESNFWYFSLSRLINKTKPKNIWKKIYYSIVVLFIYIIIIVKNVKKRIANKWYILCKKMARNWTAAKNAVYKIVSFFVKNFKFFSSNCFYWEWIKFFFQQYHLTFAF